MSRPAALLPLVLLGIVGPVVADEARPPVATAIELPDGAAGIGFDDLRFATGAHRVLAPAARTGNLILVDPETHAITAISGFTKEAKFSGGHGAGTTSADEAGELIVATDRNAKRVILVDPKKGAIVGSAALAGGPDYVRFVAPTHEIWVTEPGAKQIEIFTLSGQSLSAAATIAVPNGPESLVVDATRGRAYVHRWDDQTHAIDLAKRAIVATWPNGCAGSRGIALDEPKGFLFVGCDEGKAVVLDVAHDGKQLSSLSPGPKGVDVIAYNAALGHLYVPGEDSRTMAILRVAADGKLSTLAIAKTASGAHCVTHDDRGGVWVCSPDDGKLLYYKDALK